MTERRPVRRVDAWRATSVPGDERRRPLERPAEQHDVAAEALVDANAPFGVAYSCGPPRVEEGLTLIERVLVARDRSDIATRRADEIRGGDARAPGAQRGRRRSVGPAG